MTKIAKTLDKVLRGTSDASVSFEDLRRLLRHLEFTERIRGDHHIFSREGVTEILNLQPRGGKAKPYQVKQVRGVIAAYRLGEEPQQENVEPKEATDGSDNSQN